MALKNIKVHFLNSFGLMPLFLSLNHTNTFMLSQVVHTHNRMFMFSLKNLTRRAGIEPGSYVPEADAMTTVRRRQAGRFIKLIQLWFG
jgi:hypothetical protein